MCVCVCYCVCNLCVRVVSVFLLKDFVLSKPNPNTNPFQMRIYFYKILQKSKTHTHTQTQILQHTHTVTPRHTHTHWQLTHASSHMEKGNFWGHRIYINPYGCPSPFLRVLLQSPHHLCSYSSPLYTYATTAWACDLGSVFFGHVPK